MTIAGYEERVYSGVLGKLVGVYLGRPVEGWAYPEIRKRFGELRHYVHEDVGAPLIVADDDISGTFGFFRAVADSGYPEELSPADVGDCWLNYIVEGKTILWWGGLGRSTEHTAYLRLKSGIRAPASGSIARNGRTIAEQIGAQIFIDAFAMMHPGDPEKAAAVVRSAASVSHDGDAVEAAAFLGAMEAMAFDVRSTEALIEGCRRYAGSRLLQALIDDVVALCDGERDWRAVRAAIDERYGPHRFPGPCHIITNHAMVLAALLLGEDDFQRSVMIAASAGFDTDCNAGNVGCLNGIRLGLDAIDAQVDFRGEVADRLLVVTADGGSCVSDAVIETRKIAHAARIARGERVLPAGPRFGFEQRGSVQGFAPCPYVASPYPSITVANAGGALEISCHALGPGVPGAVSTPTFLERSGTPENFSTLASPTLYPGQLVTVRARATAPERVTLRPYVVYEARDRTIAIRHGEPTRLSTEAGAIKWRVPVVGPNPLLRLGVQIEAGRRYDGRVLVEAIDWDGAPEGFEQRGRLMSSIWDTRPRPLDAWVSSAQNFEADFRCSYSISHPDGAGVATIGTRDWRDYAVRSTLEFCLHRSAGLIARSAGHRRWYGALFTGGRSVALVKRRNGNAVALGQRDWTYAEDVPYDVTLECDGPALRLLVDGSCLVEAFDDDDPYREGGAGFVVEEGTMLADGFRVDQLVNGTRT